MRTKTEFTKVHKYVRSMFRQPSKITQTQKENIAEYYKVPMSEVDEAIDYEVKDDIKRAEVIKNRGKNKKESVVYVLKTKEELAAYRRDRGKNIKKCQALRKKGLSIKEITIKTGLNRTFVYKAAGQINSRKEANKIRNAKMRALVAQGHKIKDIAPLFGITRQSATTAIGNFN